MSGRFDSPLKSGSAERKLRKRIAIENGHAWVDDGREQFSYEVNINWDDVRQMAAKAADSKGGRCHAGPIQVKITSRKRI
jgi:hypothetical protein